MLGRKKERGRGRGEKNTPAQLSLFFWETPNAGKRSPRLGRLRGSSLIILSINCKSILFIPFSFTRNCGKELFWIKKCRTQKRILPRMSKQVFWNWSAGNVACITQWKSQSDFYTGIRTRFTCSANYKTLHHFYLKPKCYLFQFVFFLWRVDYALVGSSRQGELRILRRTATRAHFVVIINKGASMWSLIPGSL